MTIGIIQAMNKKHGILLINKPLGMSSHDVVNVLRKFYHTKKVGHAGTLDVEASGLLVCGINDGTKLLNELQTHQKTYEFEVCFNVETDTLDHTGNIINKTSIDLPKLLDLSEFIGPYQQVPPAYSAVKVNGKKLYEYARNQETIPDVKPRELFINSFKQMTEITDNKAMFKVTASSGLYVRKLALDLAKKYQAVAHTTHIHRLKVGLFSIDDASTLNDLEHAIWRSMSEALPHLIAYELNDEEAKDVSFGKPLNIHFKEPMIKCVKDNELYAIYIKKDQKYIAKRVFKGV